MEDEGETVVFNGVNGANGKTEESTEHNSSMNKSATMMMFRRNPHPLANNNAKTVLQDLLEKQDQNQSAFSTGRLPG